MIFHHARIASGYPLRLYQSSDGCDAKEKPHNPMNIEAILFDAEGVVIDTEAVWDHGQRVFLERRGLVYDRERIKPLLTGRSLVDGARVMQRELGFSGDPEALAVERLEIVRELLVEEARFMEGFEAFFETVRGRYRCCVATALERSLLAAVDRKLGLSELFDGQLFSIADVENRSKPDPALFLFAAERLGVRPERCLVIEDAPNGIEAARRAGMRCVGLTSTYEAARLAAADWVVDSFAEIERLLA